MEFVIAQRRPEPPVGRVLTLPMKAIYFDQVKAGTKPREYRLVTDFWRRRLVGKVFTHVELTRGYPSRHDTTNRLRLPWKGYTIEEITHPEFGTRPVSVFSIDVSAGACHD